MIKKKKIILAVTALVIVFVIAVIWINFDLIMVIKDGVFETQESLNIKKEETINKEQKILKDAGVENVRPLTEEEKKEFADGNITEEEVVKIITGTTEDSSQSSQETTPTDADIASANKKIAELVGKIYVLEAKFTSELTALEEWAIKEYGSLPRDRRPAKKEELIKYGFPKLIEMEKKCDADVEKVLAEMTDILKKSGQSTNLVNQIRDSYNSKKQLTKSDYINKYL